MSNADYFNSFSLVASTSFSSNPNHEYSFIELEINPAREVFIDELGIHHSSLDINPLNGYLYGVYSASISSDGLSVFAPDYGSLSLIHSRTFSSTISTSMEMDAIAFHPNGTLYGVSSNILYTIDPSNSFATQVAPISESIGTIDFAPDGTLYGGYFELYTIDPETGDILEHIADMPNTGLGDMDFAPDGYIYMVRTVDETLYRVDPSDGSSEVIGIYDSWLDGLASIPNRVDVAYSYVHVFGNGDMYYGQVYDNGYYGYSVGQVIGSPFGIDETGRSDGYYYIYDSQSLGTDYSLSGYVNAAAYYDADTGYGNATFVSEGWGATGLGSEYGLAYNSTYSNTDSFFGYGYWEADLVEKTDSLYSYAYVYGNGDAYYGQVYDDGTYGYYEGQVIASLYGTDETGIPGGYYYIYDSQNLGFDSAYTGYVNTSAYFDADTGYGSATFVSQGWGVTGLGSEYGLAYNSTYTNPDSFFGYGYWEADLTIL